MFSGCVLGVVVGNGFLVGFDVFFFVVVVFRSYSEVVGVRSFFV